MFRIKKKFLTLSQSKGLKYLDLTVLSWSFFRKLLCIIVFMKKVILFLITFTILINESFASFPISNELTINQDVVNKESFDDYHLGLHKTRFDVLSFECEDCPIKENTLKNNTSSTKLYLTSGILFLLSIITFAISMVDTIECVNRPETCNQSGVPFLASSLIFFWSSIFCFIMGVKAN